MKKNQTLFDDLLSLSGNILGNVLGARHEMKAQAKERFDMLAKQLNLVSRAEFDAAFSMLAKARLMQEELDERLGAIESKIGISSRAKNKASASVTSRIQHPVSSKTGIKTKTKRRLPSFKKSNKVEKRG